MFHRLHFVPIPRRSVLYRLALESTHSPRHGRACPGHPRLWSCSAFKTWMPATSAGMTSRESCVLVLSGITVFPLGFVALPRPRHRGETLLEIGDQIINIFEPDVEAHRWPARRPLGGGADTAAIERNDEAL